MADEGQWQPRRVAAFVLFLLYVNRRRRNRKRWNNRKVWTKRYISRNLTLGACAFIRCRRNVPQIWTILNFLDELKVRPVPNVVLLLCRTQMNLARQWHDDSTAAVSNVEPNTVAPYVMYTNNAI